MKLPPPSSRGQECGRFLLGRRSRAGWGAAGSRRLGGSTRKQNLLKYLLSITANIVPCQRGPGTAPRRLQPGRCPPQRSAAGGGTTEGHCAEGDSFVFGHSCPGLGRDRPSAPLREEGGTGVHRSAHRRGDLVHRVPLCRCPPERWHWGDRGELSAVPGVKPQGVQPLRAHRQPSVGFLPQFALAAGGIPMTGAWGPL